MQIELKQVFRTYACGTEQAGYALRDVSVSVRAGEFVAVMGRAGCGKTTLLQIMAGLLTPSEGAVLLDGEDVNGASFDKTRLRRAVGVVFQYPEHQLFATTVEKDVAFALRGLKLSRQERAQHVRAALAQVGLDYDTLHAQPPFALSGGEKRRVAIAGVLAAQPMFLLLDEPFAGLDPLARDALLELLLRLHAQGTGIVLISHNADIVGECAQRLWALRDGRLLWDGSAREALRDAALLPELGLATCAPARIAHMLAQRGVQLGSTPTRYSELLEKLTVLGRENAP